MAITINGTSNGKINNTSFSTTTGNAVTTGDSSTVTAGMLSGGQSGSAPIFGVRVWVRFDGTGTIAINGSGNVSSLTDNATGDYTINFTTAMPDGNYTIATAMEQFATTSGRAITCGYQNGTGDTTLSTSSVRVQTKMTENSSALTDFEGVSVVLVA